MDKLNTEILELYKFIEDNYKNESDEIYYSLELLLNCLVNTKNALANDISKNSGNLSKVGYLYTYATKIENLEEIIGNYLSAFVSDNSNTTEKLKYDDGEKQIVKNYNDYETPHLLSESFTYKKICAFSFENNKYNVNDWKSALIKLCEILVQKDKTKFLSIMQSDLFSGKKRKYFDFNCKEKYYRKISNTNIYVYTCHSANTICTIMQNLLREYNIPVSSLYVYLSANDIVLHNDVPKISTKMGFGDEKIGKYVRKTMRQLSNQHYNFTQDMLNKLTDGNATKNLFGIGIPFLKEVKPRIDISIQTKDVKGYNRYWKEVFRFNHKNYLIVSQWTEGNSERFKMWLKDLHI